jgi:peptidoglycan/xylan/chitin deacetylase (PgdA/CDA1 family)
MALTIVMYHYVRDLARSRFPEIKGLSLDRFRAQLAHLQANYALVTARDLVGAIRQGEALPPNAALLTFDDGYADHYANVFPLLHEQGVQGSFFPPAKCVLEDRVLDVNKVHFALASVSDKERLVDAVRVAISEHRHEHNLQTFEQYWAEHAKTNRFDPAEVIFVKRMLQAVLPEELRAKVADALFRRFVSTDEAAFARELYVSPDQLRMMVRCGMYVGSHGYDHYWMDTLTPERQRDEVTRSLGFLSSIGAPTSDWVMCYPYGAHNESLENVLRDNGCAAGLTTRVAVADLAKDDPLRLPRMDTNDLPQG